MMKFCATLFLLIALVPLTLGAQITVSHTFAVGDTISASQFNTNFTDLSSNALDRTGGTITGTIAVSTDVTIDGVDISDYLATNVLSQDGGAVGDPSFSTVGDTNTGLYFPAADSVGMSLGGTQRFLLNSSGLAIYGTVVVDGSGTILGGGSTILSKTSDYTVTTGDAGREASVLVTSSGGVVRITLYAASGNAGRILHIKKLVAANTVIIDGNSSETIDGVVTQTITGQYGSLSIVCDGSNWHIF